MENSNKSVSPILVAGEHFKYSENGLTKREHFASLAMQSIISNNDMMKNTYEIVRSADKMPAIVCKHAVQYADELLIQLEKTKK